jgi:hypothetical protein
MSGARHYYYKAGSEYVDSRLKEGSVTFWPPLQLDARFAGIPNSYRAAASTRTEVEKLWKQFLIRVYFHLLPHQSQDIKRSKQQAERDQKTKAESLLLDGGTNETSAGESRPPVDLHRLKIFKMTGKEFESLIDELDALEGLMPTQAIRRAFPERLGFSVTMREEESVKMSSGIARGFN